MFNIEQAQIINFLQCHEGIHSGNSRDVLFNPDNS